MRAHGRATLAGAVGAIVAGLIAVGGAVAALPGSGPSGSQITASGTASGIPAGTAQPAETETTAPPETTTTPAAATTVPSTAPPSTAPPTTRPTAPGTTPISSPRPPVPTTSAGPDTGPSAGLSTGPTGRLAVTLVQANGVRAIATMAADGSDERVLATGGYLDPRWTPDGRYVLFESSGAYSSWAVPAGGGPVTRLGDGAAAVVSPDGSEVVNVMAVPYATSPPQLTVQKIAETVSGLVTVGPATPLGVSGVSPVWSPDGRHILYNTDIGGSSGLAIVNADGSGRHDLLASASVKALGIDHPGFSADGSTVSFLGTDSTLYLIGADGQGLRSVLPGAFATHWSADHQRLAVLLNGGMSVDVVDTGGHVLASAHLTVGAFPVGIALDGSGQYAYYMGFPASPAQGSYLYSVALAGGASQRVGADDSAGFPLTVHPG